MVVSLLCEMKPPCNCFTLSLCVSDSLEAIVGEMTTTLRWRSMCQAGDDGAHDGALEMEIKSIR